MPLSIATSEILSDFEFLVSGRADYPEVNFSGADFDLIAVAEGDTSGGLFFGADNTVALVQGSVLGGIVGGGAGFGVVLIDENGTVDGGSANNAIGLFGTNANIVLNAGQIFGDIQLNQGQNLVINMNLIIGDTFMGAGDDFFINDSAAPLGGTTSGDVFGDVFMGSGNDVVLNAAILENVFLGSGNDFYAAITPLSLQDNFSNSDVRHFGEIRAGSGNDTVFAGANDDRIFGQSGNDVLNGHGGNDFISGGENRDVIRGGNGEDTLLGGGGSDRLFGGNGDDRMFGGNGRDILIGGRGDDRMSGGSGADIFVFNTNARQLGDDTITDFSAQDAVEIITTNGLVTFDLINDLLVYENGTATLDLEDLFAAAGSTEFTNGGGNSITFLNVNPGSLTADNFILQDAVLPEIIDVL